MRYLVNLISASCILLIVAILYMSGCATAKSDTTVKKDVKNYTFYASQASKRVIKNKGLLVGVFKNKEENAFSFAFQNKEKTYRAAFMVSKMKNSVLYHGQVITDHVFEEKCEYLGSSEYNCTFIEIFSTEEQNKENGI